jgi:hypothetical protein
MDPYVEARGLWEDFHGHLIERIYDRIAEAVPDRYLVRTGERAYVLLAETDEKREYLFKPDVGISGPPSQVPQPPGKVAVAEPPADPESVSLRAFIAEEYREKFIEIFAEDEGRRLVTCIEVLSPTNKRPGGEGWELYLRKRQGLLLGTANLVEIDLLRGGRKMPMLDPWPNSPYTLLVARQSGVPYCRVWPAFFRRPLPPIPVPLASPDPDVTLDLQPMVDAIYARSRYARDIDYTRPLQPPLAPEETAWLQEQLKARQPAP